MPILRNQRYEQFEHGTARDSFRGLPLQKFPWVLEKCEHRSARSNLIWLVEVACLETTPSGFGTKLNFTLQATAQLTRLATGQLLSDKQSITRVSQLFSENHFALEDNFRWQCEGTLEELPQLATALLKRFKSNIDSEWTGGKIEGHLSQRLKQSSPGGFGERPT